jgi:hypothetical protein
MDVDASEEDVEEAISQLDKDSDGEIDFEEFASWYLTYADESASQATTTVGGLSALAESGDIDDETYMWTEALGDDWLTYADAKALMEQINGGHFDGLPTRPAEDEDGEAEAAAE